MVTLYGTHKSGYPPTWYISLMSRRSVVKSPTSVDVVPTFVLEPLVDKRSCSLSGYGLAEISRVQNVIVSPLLNVLVGPMSQVFSVAILAPLLKFADTHEFVVPACAGAICVPVHWYQPGLVPIGSLWLTLTHPFASIAERSSNPS